MNTQLNAMKTALEAIANSGDFLFNWHDCEPNNEREMSRYQEVSEMNEKAFTALRIAIEQMQKQEPVGRVAGYHSGFPVIEPLNRRMVFPVNMALYTTPPAAPVQEPDPCPGCRKGGVCRTPKCGRLKLPTDHPYRTDPPAAPVQVQVAITEQRAHDMGAKGAEPTEAERLLFEAWMRGHCWKVTGQWNGKTYVHEAEHPGGLLPSAMNTRQLWAAWRDRAALSTPPAAQRQWVGLTDDELELLNDCGDTDSYKFARAIEAKLKGKNA